MQQSTPKVSIGLPVYNGENYLAQAVDSVLSQTFTDFELIISDNASTDQTEQICRAYQSQDSRVHYYRVEINKGAGWNFNRVVELSCGKYFKWLAHDDLIAPTFLEEAVRAFESNPQVVLVTSKVQVIDQHNQKIDQFDIQIRTNSNSPKERFLDLLLVWHNCLDVFGLIRSDLLHKTALMGNYTSGDSVLLAHLGLLAPFYKIPDFLLISRRHPLQSNVIYNAPKTGWVNQHAYNTWFNPAKNSKFAFPQWVILSEYFRIINQVDLKILDRIGCYLYLMRWMIRYRKALLVDIVIAAREFVSLINRRTKTPREQ